MKDRPPHPQIWCKKIKLSGNTHSVYEGELRIGYFPPILYFSEIFSVLLMDYMPEASPVTLKNQFKAKVVCIVMHDLARLMSSAPMLKLFSQITLLPLDLLPLLVLPCLSPLLCFLHDYCHLLFLSPFNTWQSFFSAALSIISLYCVLLNWDVDFSQELQRWS